MLYRVAAVAALALVYAIPAQASVIYTNSASPINLVHTPDLGFTPTFTIRTSFAYLGGDSGTLVDELNASGVWHDSQLEVHSDGSVFATVWPYNGVINLGKAVNGVNVATYTYDSSSQTLSGTLNGNPMLSINVARVDPVTAGYGEQIWAFGVGDGTNQGVTGDYSNIISSATISTGAVPEASTWAMLILGFAVLSSVGKYRNKVLKAI